jgi:hypothetical protein
VTTGWRSTEGRAIPRSCRRERQSLRLMLILIDDHSRVDDLCAHYRRSGFDAESVGRCLASDRSRHRSPTAVAAGLVRPSPFCGRSESRAAWPPLARGCAVSLAGSARPNLGRYWASTSAHRRRVLGT